MPSDEDAIDNQLCVGGEGGGLGGGGEGGGGLQQSMARAHINVKQLSCSWLVHTINKRACKLQGYTIEHLILQFTDSARSLYLGDGGSGLGGGGLGGGGEGGERLQWRTVHVAPLSVLV